ncbi:MAG: DNA-binding protein [Verrucomicrobiales bacterium]|nr:DNA-binding protein [Verrucomicrobiales bacterium]
MKTHALRLRSGEDLKAALDALVRQHEWPAACVLSAVGSLSHVRLRYANQPEAEVIEGPHEMVALSGTLGPDGSHLHLAVSDSAGRTQGGHLMEGSLIYTTAEIVLGVLEDQVFAREIDPQTGYRELVISPRRSTDRTA